MKIAVYTCITNNYLPVPPAGEGADFILFTDSPLSRVKAPGYQVRPLKPFFANPIRNARLPKILSHRYLPDYDYTIWLDASLQLIVDPHIVFDEMGDLSFAAFRNRRRKFFSEEFGAIRASKWSRKDRVSEDILNEQEKHYFGSQARVFYGGFIARKKRLDIQWFEEKWFGEYCVWQHRDLPSMNYSLDCKQISVKTLPGDIKDNKFTEWIR